MPMIFLFEGSATFRLFQHEKRGRKIGRRDRQFPALMHILRYLGGKVVKLGLLDGSVVIVQTSGWFCS